MKLAEAVGQLTAEIGPAKIRHPGGQIERPNQIWLKWVTVPDTGTVLARLAYRELKRVSLVVAGNDVNDLSVDDSLLVSLRNELLLAARAAPNGRPLGLAFMPDPIWHSPVTVSLVIFGPES
jgi:hypothetical protein